jgi:hypothetical protein
MLRCAPGLADHMSWIPSPTLARSSSLPGHVLHLQIRRNRNQCKQAVRQFGRLKHMRMFFAATPLRDTGIDPYCCRLQLHQLSAAPGRAESAGATVRSPAAMFATVAPNGRHGLHS